MARTCRLVRAGRGVDAQWRRQGDALLISPAAEPPLVVALAQVSGIAGDGFAVILKLPDGEVALERLGGDGPTLLEELRRDWPPLRAGVLRLAGGEAPAEFFAGVLERRGERFPCRCFLAGARLVVAPEGGDCFPVFLADCAAVECDEQAYLVRLSTWDGPAVTFGRLGGRTEAFCAAVRAAREGLSRAAEEVVAAHLPTLDAPGRAALAARWLPGRLLSAAALEGLAPGFSAAFASSWLAACPRAAEGAKLMEGVAPGDRFLGYAAAGDGEPFVWLLVRAGEAWSLELLSQGDYATYLFRGGDEVPRLVEGIVRLPEFSREALYLPLEELTGERAAYAIPARDLPLLRELRACFAGRRVHAAARAAGADGDS